MDSQTLSGCLRLLGCGSGDVDLVEMLVAHSKTVVATTEVLAAADVKGRKSVVDFLFEKDPVLEFQFCW
jgi:hypothetical protein